MPPQDILIVEDEDYAARLYGRAINRELGIEPFVETSPHRALEIVNQHTIKVLIVDQKMPELTGTELVREVQKERPDIVSIMLTGEATKEEVGEALNLGFFRYIKKAEPEENLTEKLIPAVEDALKRYNNLTELRKGSKDLVGKEIVRKEYQVLLDKEIARKTGKRFGSEIVTISIQSVGEIEKNVIKDDWQTEFTANAGMNKKVVKTFEVEQSCQLGEKFSTTHLGGFSITDIIAGIKVTLQEKLGSQLEEQLKEKVKSSLTVDISPNIPPPPNDPDQQHIVAIKYQVTQRYDKLPLVLGVQCGLCGFNESIDTALYIPTSEIAMRQFRIYRHGEPKVFEIG